MEAEQVLASKDTVALDPASPNERPRIVIETDPDFGKFIGV
jgi:hypothetical protein